MGSTPKFKAGDPVWVRSVDDELRRSGEYAGIIIKYISPACPHHSAPVYEVDVKDCPPPAGWVGWACCEIYLRPRRDDYQQREPLGSRSDLDKPLLSIDVADLNLSEERIRQLEELAK